MKIRILDPRKPTAELAKALGITEAGAARIAERLPKEPSDGPAASAS